MSLVPAHWDIIGDIACQIRSRQSNARVIGNGDVRDLDDANQKAHEYGVDGVMIGRAVFGNPWVFDPTPGGRIHQLSITERLDKMIQHAQIHEVFAL